MPINKPPLMTFILGSHCKNGVVLVADRKITIGYGEDYDECDKLFGEIRHVVYGSSGDAGMFELFRGYIMDYVNTHPGEITHQNATVKLALNALKMNKEYALSPNLYEVMVAIQPNDKPSQLNLINGYGMPYTIKNYHSIGSGTPYAQIFLKKYLRDVSTMTMEQVAEIGYFIIKYIEEFKLNYTVGGEPMIWFIPDNEKDKNGEKTDYVLRERRPQQFKSIKKRATERLRKHDTHLKDIFK